MSIRNLAALFATIITLSASQLAYAVPGDVLQTIEITNVNTNADDINQQPITPHGITFFDDHLWVLDFGTDRIYRVYTEDSTDEFGNNFTAGESDFNIPISEETAPQLPNGGDMPTCGAYPKSTQWCGGGSLTTVNNFLWNASPVTDSILKIDPGNGQVHSENNTLTNLLYPSPSAIDHDGAFFWIVDWQSNTINKVDPVTGDVIASYDGPSNDVTARAKGIAYDGLDLWVSYDSPPNINDGTVKTIYRVRPTNTPPLLNTLDFFSVPGISDPTPIEGRTPRPKGLAWDGEFLWHADSGTGKIYKLETDIMPFGITGCIMKNIVGVDSGVILSQTASADQLANTDSDGCFSFPQFTPGVPIALALNESGISGKPFIQLNETTEGSTDVILIQNEAPYSESNYDFTVTDLEESDLHDAVTATPNIIDNPGLIDISVLNETGIVIEYNVIDSDGNDAEPVYRTVYVMLADTTAPNLVLNGSSTLTIEQDPGNANLYVEPGATAVDDRDGDVTEDIIITGSVNSSAAGTYAITYTVTDLAGNTATLTRTITIKDTTPPEITILGSNPLQIEKGNAYVEAGAEVQDNVEGTITLNASNITGIVDTDTVGTYTVNYSYTDTGGNTVTANRTVNIVDTGIPTITLRGSATVNHELNTPYTDAGASAQDDTGEVISSNVPFIGSVDANAKGTYTLTYNISDASGNAAPTVTRQVIVDDTGAPSLSLLGNPTMNLQKGDVYNEPGATATDVIDNNTTLTESIVITGTVDTNTNGTYTLTYNVSDSTGNAATPLTRTINVSDTGIPVITLIGNSTINLQKGDTYTEQGATATDAVDDNTTLTNDIVITGTVDTSTNGTYTRTYNVNDSTGNAAVTVTRIINIADTGSPMISLIGNSTINLQTGDTYNEQGATATDAIDNDATLTANIVITGTVNTSINGTYIRTYNVSDSAGNVAAPVTRTINVADTGAPVITLIGNQAINLQKGDTYNEQGANATDAVDNNTTLTANIVITGTVDTNTIGSYTRTYNVSDSTGNAAATVTRAITVSDTGMPIISLVGNQTISLQTGDTYTEQGATATDAVDDNTTLTDNIVITGTVDTNTNGTYTLSYNVSDSTGNAAVTVTRTVNVADTGTPTISLIGNQTINLQKGDAYTEQGATASDAVDNNTTLTNNIVITGTVDTSNIGTYTRIYNVSDSSGNAANPVARTINVSDTGIPIITLNGSSVINHEQGAPFTDPGATAVDLVDGDMGTFLAAETVDSNSAGTYTLTYDISDDAGNAAITVTRDVIVADTIAPVITITGSTSINHEQGEAYTDQGAIALDSLDGNITITTTGTVNTNAGGVYTLSYNAVDLAGNNAATVIRNVIVADTIAPIIVIAGLTEMDHPTGVTFVDPGYTATDNFDGDISGDVATGFVVSGDQYLLSYDVNDAAGNAAATASRIVNVVTPTVVSFEAETATIGGTHSVSTTNSGFTGPGYIEHSGEGYIEYTFTSFGVPYDLTVRYAQDTGNRPLEVILNSASLGNLSFPATGSFTTWMDTVTFSLTPLSGSNTIRFQTTGSSGANVDQITLTPQ